MQDNIKKWVSALLYRSALGCFIAAMLYTTTPTRKKTRQTTSYDDDDDAFWKR